MGLLQLDSIGDSSERKKAEEAATKAKIIAAVENNPMLAAYMFTAYDDDAVASLNCAQVENAIEPSKSKQPNL